jgi:heterodisulfide reductase subunit B
MKQICASCGKTMKNNGKLYNQRGNYCDECNSRAEKNCLKHYSENSKMFAEMTPEKKNNDNEKIWKERGLII